MFTHIDWLVRLEQYKDLLREAEQERLARQARPVQTVRRTEKPAAAQRDVPSKSIQPPCCQRTAA